MQRSSESRRSKEAAGYEIEIAQEPEPSLIYDLRAGSATSGGYFANLSDFSDRLLAEIELRAGAAVQRYSHYVQSQLQESPRDQGEYSLEFLTLSVALSQYREMAECAPRWAMDTARALVCVRRRVAWLKPLADRLRAVLTRRFLMARTERTTNVGVVDAGTKTSASGLSGPQLLDHLQRVIKWMQATGEFEQEALRLDNWRKFLGALPMEEAAHLVESAMNLFEWFRREADGAFGVYTSGVRRFLAEEYRTRGCREDQIFCGREPVEYHLNMVAGEVMNRGLRRDFQRTARRVVLAPTCMRSKPAEECRARVRGTDIECMGCTPSCRVNRLTEEMRSMGARVFLVPHSTGFSRWLSRWQREPDTGVTATACLLNISPGGYEMRARGIASQCVPLDYPGCSKHWREEAIPTDLNVGRLAQILARTSRN